MLMTIDDFEKRKQMSQLRGKVLQAEKERVNQAETISITEAKRRLSKRIKKEVLHSNK